MRRPTRLGDLVRLAAEHALGEGLRRVDFALSEDLPMVDADRDQLGQVVQNLVLNADQAMEGSGRMRVEARAVDLGEGEVPPLHAGAYVALWVEDESPGIPADALGRVFDPYITTRQARHGLGLAICHSIVAKHDGHISAESGPGRGAVFTVHLPALSPGSSREPVRATDGGPRGRTRDRGLVLLFEDEAVVARAMVRMLSHLGYDVEVASSAGDTLALFDAARESGRRFDAVITDLTVPDGRGGKEVVGELKRREPEVPVATGYGNDPVVAAHRDHGFDACLVKPITVKELGRVLRQLLENRDPAGV